MLSSQLLRRDERLQKCSVDNPSHVKQGDSGPYVKLIQIALLILDDADIAEGEIKSALYGQTTADAVLKYKTKRSIINRSYQTSPDAIVGIMTITTMDSELLKKERQNAMLAAGSTSDVRTRRA